MTKVPSAPAPAGGEAEALRMRGRATLGAKLLLLFVGLVFGLLLLESFLRFYDPFGQRILGDQIVLPKNLQLTMYNHRNRRIDPEIHFATNSIGFRGEERPIDFDGHLTLLAVGGSTTECLFLSNGNSWPVVLGRTLSPSFDRLWINNAGLDGHSTFGHLFLLDQVVVKLKPKIVLFLIGINDVGRMGKTGREGPRRDPSVIVRLARKSATLATALNLMRYGEAKTENLHHEQVDLLAMPKVGPDPALAQTLLLLHRQRYLESYRERVREIVEVSRRHGIEPVLLTQPALYGRAVDPLTLVNLGSVYVTDERRIKGRRVRGSLAWDILEVYNDVVRDVGRDEDVFVVDVARRLTKSSQFFYDYVHFTNDGAQELARVVAAELCPFMAERFPQYVSKPCQTPTLSRGRWGEALMESTLVIREEIDLGNEPEAFYELLGEGWLDPETEGAVDFRRSRGKRSWLSVPIRRVGDFVFVLRARSEVTKAPVEVRLDVNGHTVGSELLSDEWSEYSFDVPSKALTVGLNTLTFVYSTTTRAIDPAFRGQNTAVAVDRLRFVPQKLFDLLEGLKLADQGSGLLTPAREIAPMRN